MPTRRRAARLASAAYAAAARLLPARFRDEYLDEALLDFDREVDAAAARHGTAGLVLAALRGLTDLTWRIPAEHMDESRRRRAGGVARPGAGGRAPGGMERMRTMWKELRLAARALVRRPAFSAVAVVTLALGIGATVAIFTVVHGVLIRPLPYPDSGRLVVVNHHAPGLGLPQLNNSAGTLRLYREQARSFDALAAYGVGSQNLLVGDRADRVQVANVTPTLFQVLQTQPFLGRPLNEEDAREGAAPVLLLSHAAWSGRFGRDPAVLGTTIDLDGEAVEVIGVMPEGFAFPSPEVLGLAAMYVDPQGPFGEFGLRGLARLAPGVSLESARQEATDLQARIPEMFDGIAQTFLDDAGWSASVTSYREVLVGDVRAALWIVLGTVGFVLLIACANVANLFLVRAEARQKELAVRAALGAGRKRLATGYFSESFLLAAVGGLAGLALAAVGVEALVANGPAELPRLHEVGIDGTVLAFTLALAVLAGLGLGALPVGRYLGRSFASVLREGGRGSTDGRARHRTRNLLVTVQLALALVLLVGSGLMLRTFQALRAVDPGFDPNGVMTAAMSRGEGGEPTVQAAFYQQVVDAVAALPGVDRAGVATSIPVAPESTNGGSFYVESRPRGDDELPPVAMWDVVGPGYFEAMGIGVLEGRTMVRGDHEEGRQVIWVSENLARTFLNGDAVGERIRFGEEEPWLEVVGVVGDVRNFGLREDVRPVAYLPMHVDGMTRQDLSRMVVVAHTAGDPISLAPAIRRVVADADPRVPITDVRTMADVVADSMADTSFTMVLLGIAAGVALLLGAVGIYGVIAYVVSQRTREIGVRMALGARGEDVRGMVVRQGLNVTVLGVALGLVGAFGLTRLMSSVLFGVSATDPATFALVPVVLVGVSVLASYLPARRASRIDPNEALRNE